MTDDIRARRRDVARGCRILGREGHGDLVWGHVSARDTGGRGVWMKAAGWGFDEVDETRTLLVSRRGSVLEGEGRRHAEYPIHTEIVAARPDVGAVVHTHAPHAVALAASGWPLRPYSHEATLFVPPAVPRFERTADLILSAELGREVATTLGPHAAIFLINHGIVTVGPDVPTATLRAVLLERACSLQLKVHASGREGRWTDDLEALEKREHCYGPVLLRQAWDHLVRELEEPR